MTGSTTTPLEAFLFANTPGFLYRTLRASAAVAELARRPAGELLEVVRSTAQREDATAQQIADAYAALMAMTFHEAVDWDAVDAITHGSRLHWSESLLAIHRAKHLPTQVMQMSLTPVLSDRLPQSSATSAFALETP